MQPSFRDFIEKLRLTADIVEVVGRHVELKRAGSRYKGLCPFHQEKTPSFTVSPERQSFYCFGCNAGGDSIAFLQRIENLEWRDAVEQLARRYGLEVPAFRGKDEDERERKHQEALLSINAMAMELYADLLRHPQRGEAARQYLNSRGLDEETVRQFAIGLAPDGWDNLLRHGKSRGFTEEAMIEAGLLYRNEEKGRTYDRFRNRIIFPIWDSLGRPIACGGRIFAPDDSERDAPKYINSPETPIYRKGDTLYAYHLARDAIKERGQAIVLEGYTDVIALHRNGFTNAVASLGTALTPRQAQLLRRQCREVVFLYDDDEAGRNAMIRGTEILLLAEMQVRCVGLKEGDDPDSYLRAQGRDAFAARLAAAKPFFEYFLDLAAAREGLKSLEGRKAAAELMKPLIKAVKNPIEAEDYIQRLGEALETRPEAVRTLIFGGAGRGEPARRKSPTAPPPGLERDDLPHRAELAMLRILIDFPRSVDILEGFDPDCMEDPRARTWLQRILAGAGDWAALLDQAADVAEANFLRQVALLDVAFDSPDAALRQAAHRLEARRRRGRARYLARDLREAELNEDTRSALEEIHRLERERAQFERESLRVSAETPKDAE